MITPPDSNVHLPVYGYHGTTSQAAEKILANGFQLSRNPYDWLGDGVYFFQDGRERAWEWALDHHGQDAAVIGAEIQLIDCLDMLDTKWTTIVTEAYDQFLQKLKESDMDSPPQTLGAHRLDRAVINYAVGVLAEKGIEIRCVRASFAEGHPVYPHSAFFDRAHVQIAVRDVAHCVRRVWSEGIREEGGQSG